MVDRSKVKVPEFTTIDLNTLPIALPKIEIDGAKCTVPFWCKKCLEVCPQLVFWVEGTRNERLRESDPREPGLYRLMSVRRDKCTLCNRCVEVCPEGAITITYEGKVSKGTAKGLKTEEAAKKSPYPLFEAPKSYSFDLNDDMMNFLRQEFDPRKIVAKFAEAIAGKGAKEIDKVAKDIFTEYGEQWMKKVLQVGEEYPDRTYEVLKEAIDETGESFFPHVPQRILEIAYLSIQQFRQLPVLENYSQILWYRVPNCYPFQLIKEKCGSEVANLMPCRYACLQALATLQQDLDLGVLTEMKAATAKDGCCEFSMRKI